MATDHGAHVDRSLPGSNHAVPAVDDLQGIEDVGNIAWWANQAIKLIGGALILFFAWLQFPFGALVHNTTPELLTKGTLVFYYFCWVAGCTFDTKIQQKVYVTDPKFGQITFDLLAAIGGGLLWLSSSFGRVRISNISQLSY